MLTKVLVSEGGDANGPVVDERRENQCAGSGDVPCVPTSGDQDVDGDCCARSSPGSAGGIAAAAAAAATIDNDGEGNDQRQLSRFSTGPVPVTPTTGVSMEDLSRFSPEQVPVTPTTGVSLQDLEAAVSCAEKAPKTNEASRVLVGMSAKSKAVSKVVASPFRRRGKSTTP